MSIMRLIKSILVPPSVAALGVGAVIGINWLADNHPVVLLGFIVGMVWIVWSYLEYTRG